MHFKSNVNHYDPTIFFNHRPKEEKDGTKYVTISQPTVNHCKSTVGKYPGVNDELYVELDRYTCSDRDIYHEFLHTIGLLHEHQR